MPDHPSSDLFAGYQAEAWQEYWSRGWCRVEALMASTVPVLDGENRAEVFNRGALSSALKSGRRPHFVFGTKEFETSRPPRSLPPLLNSHLDTYAPEKGEVTQDADLQVILNLSNSARAMFRPVIETFRGESDEDGRPHGFGIYSWPDGSVYDGFFEHGLRHGYGAFTYSDGRVYEGQWEHDLKTGFARFTFADGGVHQGDWVRDVREGYAVLTYPDGVTEYRGMYEKDKRHGLGTLTFASDRESQAGLWENGTFVGLIGKTFDL